MTKLIAAAPQSLGMTPTKPGAFIKEEVIEPSGLSQQQAAKLLGVSRQALSNLLRDKAELTPMMAARIELVFGVKAETLLRIKAWSDTVEAQRLKHSDKLANLRSVTGTGEKNATRADEPVLT